MKKDLIPTIGFLSAANYYDRNTWSGTLYYMYKALKESGQRIVPLGSPSSMRLVERAKGQAKRVLPNLFKEPQPGTPEYAQKYEQFADIVNKQLKHQPCDILFAPGGSAELTFLETKLPTIYLSDVTFKLFCRHYHSELRAEEADCLEYQEKTAIGKATALIYPSAWAASSAVEDYQASPASIEVIPFGANLEEIPDVKDITTKSPEAHCRLLWVGRDWKRKGGQIAVETLLSLKKRGISASLTIIGCIPPRTIPVEDITIITNIDKNRPEQKRLLQSYFNGSHFFIFPTRAECYGIVLCEASAYGLPILASDVGGIPTIIEDGKNGHLLPLEANGEDYADVIAETIVDPKRYSSLAMATREAYERRLNWSAWAESFRAVVKKTWK